MSVFTRLFGRPSASSAPAAAPSKARATAESKLEATLEKLRARVDVLDTRIETCRVQAVALAQCNRPKAVEYMQRRRSLQTQRQALINNILSLERQHGVLQQQSDLKDVVDATKATVTELKTNGVNPDDVDDLADELEELAAGTQVVSNALTAGMAPEYHYDTSELETELDDLEIEASAAAGAAVVLPNVPTNVPARVEKKRATLADLAGM